MQNNFFKDQQFQKVLKLSGKITAAYNNKYGFFLVYPLYKKYTIIYTGSEITEKNKTYLRKIAKKHNAIYTLSETTKKVDLATNSFKEFIPRATRQIRLSKSCEEILSEMHSKGRYNSKLAQKKGLKVENKINIDHFYDLLVKTSTRDSFSVNNKKYYQELIKNIDPKRLHVYSIYKDDNLIAASIIYDHNETAYYLYGASDHKYRNYMAPYLIQHTAIFDAKKRNLKTYDFLGISPYSPHPLDKVSEFKRKFGGEKIYYKKNQITIHKPLIFGLLKLRKVLKKYMR